MEARHDAKRTALQRDLTTLDNRAAEDWATFREGFELRMHALEAGVSEARARL